MPAPAKPKSNRLILAERLERIEEMLASGIPSGKVETVLATEYGVSRRQVRNYIQRVYQLREQQRIVDAPYRRENLLRKIERFYAKCLAKEKFGPAAQILVLEARLSGALTQHPVEREAALDRIGAPPEDAAQVLPYARKVLMAQMHEVMMTPGLDLERRQRMTSDIAAKLGMLFSRAEFEDDFARMQAILDGRQRLVSGVKIVDAKSITRPATARGSRGRRGPRPVPGPGAGPGPGKGQGDPPDGGGDLG